MSFQNEFLAAQEGDTLLVSTPDLITLIDANIGEPVTTEMVKYGLSVNVLGLPCDPIWRTDAGLELVGPGYFGIDVDYVPLWGSISIQPFAAAALMASRRRPMPSFRETFLR